MRRTCERVAGAPPQRCLFSSKLNFVNPRLMTSQLLFSKTMCGITPSPDLSAGAPPPPPPPGAHATAASPSKADLNENPMAALKAQIAANKKKKEGGPPPPSNPKNALMAAIQARRKPSVAPEPAPTGTSPYVGQFSNRLP